MLVVVALLGAACSGDDTTDTTQAAAAATTAAPTTSAAPATTVAPTTAAPTTTTTAKPPPEHLWEESTETSIVGSTERSWSNKVELADIDGDGDVDMLFADGGDQSRPGDPVVSQAWLNDGNATFTDVSTQVFGTTAGSARAIKARDVNGDGMPDLIIANTWSTQSRLLLNRGDLVFEDVTATHLPERLASSGDVEAGDVDGDGDLDLVLSDWGGVPPALNAANTMLWLNDGAGIFTDATAERMPDAPVSWSWELELVDVDNDFDLDIAVSCKSCTGSFLFKNDGDGFFSDATAALPQSSNNYEFEAIDLTGDGFLDLVTLNDNRADLSAPFRNHLLVNDGAGGFSVAGEDMLAPEDNPSHDDNMAVFLDFDSDGDADVLIGNLGTNDRLLRNDGAGVLTLVPEILGGRGTGGVLGMAVADLNGDGRMDLVQSQGEVGDMTNRVFLGALVEPDTAPPVIGQPLVVGDALVVRVHDNKSPLMPYDFTSVVVVGEAGETPLAWYGGYLWRAAGLTPGTYSVCAVDWAGNESCSEEVTVG
ncbi:MAG: VCBS repeat-containing protein [Acidimicrobiia bacterium]|nr:VCBS repeat-containing protein [Acidimicrobiia bacterium]